MVYNDIIADYTLGSHKSTGHDRPRAHQAWAIWQSFECKSHKTHIEGGREGEWVRLWIGEDEMRRRSRVILFSTGPPTGYGIATANSTYSHQTHANRKGRWATASRADSKPFPLSPLSPLPFFLHNILSQIYISTNFQKKDERTILIDICRLTSLLVRS